MRSLCCVVAVTATTLFGSSQEAHLVIKAARITEHPPFDRQKIDERRVTLTLTLGGAPRCSPVKPGTVYLFLIDADRSRRTGVVARPFTEVGVDAEITIHCDAASTRFISRLGAVVVTHTKDVETPDTLELTTTVGALPSRDFSWVAVARDGRAQTRYPPAGRVGAWRILELWRR